MGHLFGSGFLFPPFYGPEAFRGLPSGLGSFFSLFLNSQGVSVLSPFVWSPST